MSPSPGYERARVYQARSRHPQRHRVAPLLCSQGQYLHRVSQDVLAYAFHQGGGVLSSRRHRGIPVLYSQRYPQRRQHIDNVLALTPSTREACRRGSRGRSWLMVQGSRFQNERDSTHARSRVIPVLCIHRQYSSVSSVQEQVQKRWRTPFTRKGVRFTLCDSC